MHRHMPVRAGSKQQVPAASPAQIEAQLRAHYPVSHSTQEATWRSSPGGTATPSYTSATWWTMMPSAPFRSSIRRRGHRAGGDHAAADTAGGRPRHRECDGKWCIPPTFPAHAMPSDALFRSPDTLVLLMRCGLTRTGQVCPLVFRHFRAFYPARFRLTHTS